MHIKLPEWDRTLSTARQASQRTKTETSCFWEYLLQTPNTICSHLHVVITMFDWKAGCYMLSTFVSTHQKAIWSCEAILIALRTKCWEYYDNQYRNLVRNEAKFKSTRTRVLTPWTEISKTKTTCVNKQWTDGAWALPISVQCEEREARVSYKSRILKIFQLLSIPQGLYQQLAEC